MRITLDELIEKRNHVSQVDLQLQTLIHSLQPYQTSFHSRVNDLLQRLETSQIRTRHIADFIQDSYETYEQVEAQLSNHANTLTSINTWQKEYLHFAHKFNFKNQSKFTFKNNLLVGGTLTGTASFSFYHAWKQYQKDHVSTAINVNVGYANVSGKCKAVLFQDKQFNPSLNIAIDAKASVLNMNGKVGYETDYFGVEADGGINVGTVKATAKAVLSKEEISLKAEYGVAAVSGKAHGRISLLGFHLDTTVEGEMLAFSGGAEFSKGKSYVEIGGKLSLFAGLGFKIKISHD